MAGVKFTSYVDAIAREVRVENLADIKASLEVVEAENNLTFQSISKLAMRIAAVEADAAAEHRHVLHRIEKLERKGEPEGSGGNK